MQETLPLSRIVQGKNPREYFDPQEMAELEDGIRTYGVLQAILVRPIEGSNLVEIVAGERRWRAAKNVFGDDYDMPVKILEVGDTDADAIALIENFHRADISVAEEAKAAQRQLYRNNGDKEETARQLGWNVALLERRLALLACTPAVLGALTKRQILVGHAELLAGVPPTTQDKVLAGVVAHQVTVTVLKKQLGQYARRLADAIFDTAQCAGCIHNSARQAGLFAESLGDGYCQHPTHFNELTMQVIEAKAAALKDEYQVIRIVKPSDGFQALHLSAEGELGVGAEQYSACKGCRSFGCAVSAMAGSYGYVTKSLCFDAACNTKKVADWRQAARKGVQAVATPGSGDAPANTNRSKTGKPKPSNQTPQRVLQYRIEQWRRWAANELMGHPERNQRVLIALTLAGRGADLSVAQYGKAVGKMIGEAQSNAIAFHGHLERVVGVSTDQLSRLLQAVAASAAFGVDETNLGVLLNYLEVEEERQFQLNKTFLELFTMSELESLATELGLRKAMGERFKTARAGKKDAFIDALLTVKSFEYQGAVPQVMRYPRKPLRHTTGQEAGIIADGSGSEHEAHSQECEESVPA
ncbi:PRTRC system ParB family protein [Noviherbaspirillum sp. ST9]|uniref:PRTRC system ParB family protein n=1 Tax=Noviherbaspirillum sp. ST9 TaxID=3401606 RepID=UPI003B58AF84